MHYSVKWYERNNDNTALNNTVTTGNGQDLPNPVSTDDGGFVVDHIFELQLIEFAFADQNRNLNDKSKAISDAAWTTAQNAVSGANRDNCKSIATTIKAIFTKIIAGNTNTNLDPKWADYLKVLKDYLSTYSNGVPDMLTATGKAFDDFCDDDENVSAYFVDFCTNAFQAGQAYLEDQIDATGTTGAPPAAPPARWSYTFHSYTGNLATGNFSYFVLPGKYNGNFGSSKRSFDAPTLEESASHPHAKRAIAAREEPSATDKSLDKRLGGAVPIEPEPTPTHYPGQVYVWTQNGSGATQKGPLTLDCTVPEDQWQGFNPSDTGLPAYLELQSGHACSFDSADNNLDNLHAKYNAEYQDIPDGVSTGWQCVEHDNGVTCNAFTQ
ncbi:hypothetical protein P7C71_g5584, partial [Lecanoromycetidae sp. Uapishka_2]